MLGPTADKRGWAPDSVLGSAPHRCVIAGSQHTSLNFSICILTMGITIPSLAVASGMLRGPSGMMIMEHSENVKTLLSQTLSQTPQTKIG